MVMEQHIAKREKMAMEKEDQEKTIQERIAEEDLIREKVDKEGRRWKKVYFGGGEHFKNWLEQCKELGDVEVEEADPTGYKCFELGGEKLYRIWMRIDDANEGNLF